MFTYPVAYKRPTSVDEARGLLAENSDAKILAGGQSLVATMKLRLARPSAVIDLGAVQSLSFIRVEGQSLEIGAMTRHAQVAASSEVHRTIPALAVLAGGIGDRMVRNMGTIGGSVAYNDPAADYPAGLMALDATVVTHARKIAADDFFKGLYETALQSEEIIVAVQFKIPRRAAYVKFKQPASRFATVGVFVADFGAMVRVAVTGAAAGVFRIPEMEKALAADFRPDAIANIVVDESALMSDMHAQADYRAHLVNVMARRAVAAARG